MMMHKHRDLWKHTGESNQPSVRRCVCVKGQGVRKLLGVNNWAYFDFNSTRLGDPHCTIFKSSDKGYRRVNDLKLGEERSTLPFTFPLLQKLTEARSPRLRETWAESRARAPRTYVRKHSGRPVFLPTSSRHRFRVR